MNGFNNFITTISLNDFSEQDATEIASSSAS
ncbi:hypothetical protein FAES_0453 [Fibrella aestuarina BUZ 2]|uniref:Uncharacterized protein n=1 Tax=Fibrella aestuarina BUZ 2 TaxID=1166018 RepID=I0K2W2_9BACT|nr:hypothetical protein FAES_0453 [Fibrella aestuarina BUZ 2]